MKMRNVITITKKEILGILSNPSMYLVLVAFGLLWQFLYFRSLFLVGEASTKGLFDMLPWLLLILVPAVTMGSISKEKEDGTLELFVTHPIKELELVTGKYVGSMVFLIFSILISLPVAISISRFGLFDWGVYLSQIIASVLLISAFISLGIYVSSLLKSQIASLLITVVLGLLLILAGSEIFTIGLPYYAANFVERLSFVVHFQSITKGALDLRDFWYFVSFTGLFLYLTYLQFLKNKYGNNKKMYLSYQTGALLLVAIAVLSNIIGNRIPGRIDFTQEKIYTLSGSTKNVLDQVDDIVTISLYASKELPAQYSPVLRETKDLLRDYANSSNGNIRIVNKDPSEDEEAQNEALSAGIRQVQFNVIGQEEFQVKNGYLGLSIGYGSETEVIPFIQDLGDLEYEVTSLIKKLTNKDKKTIGFLTGHGEKSIFADYSLLNNELQKQFIVKSVSFNEDNYAIAEDIDVLVIAAPVDPIDDQGVQSIKSFIENGKNALLLVEKYNIDPQTAQVTENINSFSELVGDYGITINQDLVYDLQANNTIRTGGGLISYFVPYPLWVKSLVQENNSPITKKIETVDIPWGSSINIDEALADQKGYEVNVLLTTTPFSGKLTQAVDLNPGQNFSNQNLSQNTMSVALSPKQESPSSSKGKIVVIGDADFLLNDLVQSSVQNLAFGINSLSWLTETETLADIKVKNRTAGTLLFEKDSDKTLIRYGNMSLALLIPSAAGLYVYMRRKNLRTRKYEF